MINDTHAHTQGGQHSRWAGRLAIGLLSHLQRILKALDDRRQMRELYRMSASDLKDIGVTRNDVDREVMKPVRWW